MHSDFQSETGVKYIPFCGIEMPTRKGGTTDYKSHQKSKGNVSHDYDINYYGDDDFLKISSYENEKNFVEARISELERRNNALERRNKALVVSVIILLILSFGTLLITFLHKVNIEEEGVQSQTQSEIQVQMKVPIKPLSDLCYYTEGYPEAW